MKITYILMLALLAFSSCSDFEEMNKPKTGSDLVDPDPMFTRTLVTGSSMTYQNWQWLHQLGGGEWAQHWANAKPGFTSDSYEPGLGDTMWKYFYSRKYFAPLNYNFQTQKLINEIDANPVKLACTRIWNVYMFHIVTDLFGDVPYSKAFESNKPEYDTQAFIYNDMLEELEASIAQIDDNKAAGYETFGSADVLYQGDLEKWVKFANALKLRLALRMSNVDETASQKYIASIALDRIISDNNESALLLTETAEQAVTHEVKNAMGFVYSWEEVRMSKTMMAQMDGTTYGVEDPRLKQYAEPAKADSAWRGLANGYSTQYLNDNIDSVLAYHCNIGPYFNTQNYEVELFLLTNAEVNFLLAEAAHKGYLAGGQSAAMYYHEGIRASMAQYKMFWDGTVAINDADVDAYLAADGVAFDATKAVEQIITQKWIALYTNGQEAWSEMRRTGYPSITTPVYTYPGNDAMPRRVPYSSDEMKYNRDNYDAAVARMGGDGQYTRMWWDTLN